MLFTFRGAPGYTVALLWLCAAGCGTGSTERFVPKATIAREALETALNAWKDGRSTGPIESHAPPIQVVDSLRTQDQALAGFVLYDLHAVVGSTAVATEH